MTEDQKDVWAGVIMTVLFVAIPLVGWLVLKFLGH
jgi:hypothetical protein